MLKILCLHGYTQNSTIFRERTGSLRKALKGLADFHFITAPVKLRQEDESRFPIDEESYGWWLPSNPSPGIQASLELIDRVCMESGPFDGLLGFSQGASMSALVLAHQQRFKNFCRSTSDQANMDTWKNFHFSFAMLFSGFSIPAPAYSAFHEVTAAGKIELPTLHVFGEQDGVIHVDRSIALAAAFSTPTEFKHPGGHFIPAQSQHRELFCGFVSKFAKTPKA